jgi:hypothetical protein
MSNRHDNPLAALGDYDLHHLPDHLEAVGQIGQLHGLLALQVGQGQHALFERMEEAGRMEWFLDWLARAWREARTALAGPCRADGTPPAIVRDVRCALLASSVNTLVGTIHAPFLVEAVRRQLRDPAQVVELARLILAAPPPPARVAPEGG